ncbi:acyl-ACP desaturase [Actinokineospora diospyrosa]|uniref:Fatty acid desaturase n=1 Tax=Actinokineospora diospyrosa TaxID=103728 RepID=A0ABT1IJB0_9PSEU|nr:acyl-ACP desaturase [Actinokineospora diospyrosa]MCP2272728.1 Fatty acid desaturase [Actinokineospora diospyrosa]
MHRQVGGPLLPAAEVDAAVGTFLRAGRTRWDEFDFDWPLADASRLTDGQRSAVEFITIIEDHLPGYFALYDEHFPLNESVEREVFVHNRELYHFSIRWAQEEDTHARTLFRYQVESGLASASGLRDSLAVEGQKKFAVDYADAVQFFTYPLVQEKATQLYYQNLRQVIDEPVLGQILNRLSRDEARHFTFFADMLQRYLVRYGDAVVEPVRAVIADFRMPLADTIRGYWRWALKIADTARYDHTDAYDYLIKVLNRAVDAKSDKVTELIDFIAACRTINA